MPVQDGGSGGSGGGKPTPPVGPASVSASRDADVAQQPVDDGAASELEAAIAAKRELQASLREAEFAQPTAAASSVMGVMADDMPFARRCEGSGDCGGGWQGYTKWGGRRHSLKPTTIILHSQCSTGNSFTAPGVTPYTLYTSLQVHIGYRRPLWRRRPSGGPV